MNVDQAFAVLRDAAFAFQGNRQQHLVIDQAAQIVAAALESKPNRETRRAAVKTRKTPAP